MTYYEQKMKEYLNKYHEAVEKGDTDEQNRFMREYLNYERMSKMAKV